MRAIAWFPRDCGLTVQWHGLPANVLFCVLIVDSNPNAQNNVMRGANSWSFSVDRADVSAATRIALDEEYMLLLWKHDDKPKRICDIFWLKHIGRYSIQLHGHNALLSCLQ